MTKRVVGRVRVRGVFHVGCLLSSEKETLYSIAVKRMKGGGGRERRVALTQRKKYRVK